MCGALLNSFVWLGVFLSLSECIVVFNKYVRAFVCACARTLACSTVMASRDRDRLKNLAQEVKRERDK